MTSDDHLSRAIRARQLLMVPLTKRPSLEIRPEKPVGGAPPIPGSEATVQNEMGEPQSPPAPDPFALLPLRF